MKPLVIVGSGGFAREVLDVVEAINAVEERWRFLGFLDDHKSEDALVTSRGAAILGPSQLLTELDCEYVIAIADPAARERIDALATGAGREAATLVHPGATVGSVNSISPGLVATAGSCVTTNVQIGRHVHLNLGSTVGHDVVLGPYVTINPGAHISGNVTLEDGVTIGTGASVIQGLKVGRRSFVGAGAVVTKDVGPGLVVIGIPARPLAR